MKSSPLKVTAGGVTPQTEQEPVLEKPKKNTKVADAIVDFITPDSIGEALMNFIPFGGVGGKAIGKTKVFQQLMKKVPGLEKIFKSGKTITKKQKFDFQKGLDDSLKAKGGVVGGNTPAWSKGVTDYGDAGIDAINGALTNMKQTGKYLDKIGFKASEMSAKNMVFHGTKHGRSIVEIALPNGKTQLMYKSSGLANKAGGGAGGTTEGMWQPYGGHAANGSTKNWFIKDEGYENFYGSKSFRDIAGNLDRIAAEEGWDLSKQALKSKLKK